jgi:hypothetical protein
MQAMQLHRFITNPLPAAGFTWLLAASLMGPATPARATLGQAPLKPSAAQTSTTPRAAKASGQTPTSPAAYTEQTTTLETGTVMREFVNAQGLVFAVSWTGPVLPDLGALFGDYFQHFRAEAERNRASRKRGAPIALSSDAVVMVSRGRMGHFSGHAYVPALIPTGVNIDDLLR